MKSLNIYGAFLLLMAFSCQALADYASDLSVNRYYVSANGYVYFGTTPRPNNTCSFWGGAFPV